MKKIHSLIAVILVAATILSLSGCARFKRIDDEDQFFDALENAVGIDEDETIHEKNSKVNGDKVEYLIYTGDGDNFYTYIRFKNADDAMDYFDEFYQGFEDLKEDKEFDGSNTMSMSKTRGMILFDGEVEAENGLNFYHMNKYFFEDTEIYGGVYVYDNVYIEVYSANGSKRDKEKIKTFLKTLKFPTP